MTALVPRDLSVVFISFDEPAAEENFETLRRVVPEARRVHGVLGFDAAHNRAGDIAETPHVVTVDGDNVVRDAGFFARPVELVGEDHVSVVSFSARIRHNGLAYGNGGLKIWPRSLLRTLRTHERAAGIDHPVDFVWRIPYVAAQGVPTETVVTAAPFQAYRAGFREGYRLAMTGGVLPRDAHPDAAPGEALARHVTRGNLERIRIWCAVGRDAEHGDWAMLGAREGLLAVAGARVPPALLADFDGLRRAWEEQWEPRIRGRGLAAALAEAGAALREEVGVEIPELDAAGSRFFREHYRPVRLPGRILPR